MTSNDILAACTAISAIGGAVIIIYKFVSPALRLSKRITVLEDNQKATFDSIEEIKETNKLLCKGVCCLLDEASKNSEEVQTVKKEMNNFLINNIN